MKINKCLQKNHKLNYTHIDVDGNIIDNQFDNKQNMSYFDASQLINNKFEMQSNNILNNAMDY